MSEFILFFRLDISPNAQPSPEQVKVYMEQWEEWLSKISAHNKLIDGNHLSNDGRVVKDNGTVTQGPYTEKKKSVAGYVIINAKDYNQAVKVAESCPILRSSGNSVEVRKITS
jgi:hypothetical protein